MKPLYLSRRTEEKIVEDKKMLICAYLGNLVKRR